VTPSNAGYYHAAYVAAVAVYVLYGLSIAVRTRLLRMRLNEGTRSVERT
jgi:hypothetical protein